MLPTLLVPESTADPAGTGRSGRNVTHPLEPRVWLRQEPGSTGHWLLAGVYLLSPEAPMGKSSDGEIVILRGY